MYCHNPFYSPCVPYPPFPQQICCTTIFPTYQQPVYAAPTSVKPTYVQPVTSNQPNLPNLPNVPNQPNMYGRMF
ncbi:hypothetical protein [Ectobacillus sp. sgz5001026]|uniref:hypothetical protein n=1 Tax=Ectobacillus sp. sgz5001026 TaxID=3242473 RepID=UPI0036D4212F